MRQNKNKNITKITSGALVLLLASGGLVFNSQASGETIIGEGDNVLVDKNETESSKIENLDEALDNPNNVNDNTETKNDNSNLINSFNEKISLVKSITYPKAGFNEEFKNRAKAVITKYEGLINKNSSEDEIRKAIDELQLIISDQSNNLTSIEDTDEKVIDEEENQDSQPSKDNTKEDSDINSEDNKTETDDISDKTNTDSKEENSNDLKNDESKEEKETEKNNEIQDDKENKKEENNKKTDDNLEDKKDTSKQKLPYSNKEEFIEYLSIFSDKAKAKNIFPSVMIGQAIHESANGTSKLTTEEFNIFGIKSTNKNKGKSYKTEEYVDGKLIKTVDKFRMYDSFEEAIDYYLDLLNGGRYADHKVAEAKTAKEQLERIQAAGYATDPHYVAKVLRRINEENLVRFDIGFKGYTGEENPSKSDEKIDKNNETKKTNPDVNNNSNQSESSKPNKETQKIDNEKTDEESKQNQNNKNKIDSSKDKENSKKESESNEINEDEKNFINKDKLAGEINKIKILLKDGSWTKKSSDEAKKILNEIEKSLTKDKLTTKEYNKLVDDLNYIQINVLKEAKKVSKDANKDENTNARLVKKVKNTTDNKTEVKNESTNVKTGVGSLSSILLTITGASSALFASRKRK